MIRWRRHRVVPNRHLLDERVRAVVAREAALRQGSGSGEAVAIDAVRVAIAQATAVSMKTDSALSTWLSRQQWRWQYAKAERWLDRADRFMDGIEEVRLRQRVWDQLRPAAGHEPLRVDVRRLPGGGMAVGASLSDSDWTGGFAFECCGAATPDRIAAAVRSMATQCFPFTRNDRHPGVVMGLCCFDDSDDLAVRHGDAADRWWAACDGALWLFYLSRLGRAAGDPLVPADPDDAERLCERIHAGERVSSIVLYMRWASDEATQQARMTQAIRRLQSMLVPVDAIVFREASAPDDEDDGPSGFRKVS